MAKKPRYEPPPARVPEPQAVAPPADPLAFLDAMHPVLLPEEVAGILRRDKKSVLSDRNLPWAPLNDRVVRLLREDLRAYLEGCRRGNGGARMALQTALTLQPQPMSMPDLCALLRTDDTGAEAAIVAARRARGLAAPSDILREVTADR